MTKQIDDIVIYNENRYIILGYSGSGLFQPNPQWITSRCTNCYRGYHNIYSIIEDQLCLIEANIYFGQDDEEKIRLGFGPKLFGKTPIPFYYDGFQPRSWPFKDKKVQIFSGFHKVEQIKEPISFNGSLLLGHENNDIREILFSNGRILKILNRSGEKGDLVPKLHFPSGIDF